MFYPGLIDSVYSFHCNFLSFDRLSISFDFFHCYYKIHRDSKSKAEKWKKT